VGSLAARGAGILRGQRPVGQRCRHQTKMCARAEYWRRANTWACGSRTSAPQAHAFEANVGLLHPGGCVVLLVAIGPRPSCSHTGRATWLAASAGASSHLEESACCGRTIVTRSGPVLASSCRKRAQPPPAVCCGVGTPVGVGFCRFNSITLYSTYEAHPGECTKTVL
jgi:hypothetical protein